MAVLEEKLGGGPMDHAVGLRVVSGALFLGSSRVHPTLLMACKRYVDWRGKRTCRVGWVFPYRMYIDSNCHDSRT
jgi:hypothetical protein